MSSTSKSSSKQVNVNSAGVLIRAKNSLESRPPVPRIVTLDDHELLRAAIGEAVQRALAKPPDAQWNTFAELQQDLRTFGGDLVILDLMLTEGDIRPQIPALISEFSQTRILVLSGMSNSRQIAKTIQLGVHGFVHKSQPVEIIALAIQDVWVKGRYLCPRATQALMEAIQGPQDEEKKIALLSKRELELLETLVAGTNIKEAAEKLNISEKTAYSHRAALLRKTETTDNVGLVCFAIRAGLVEISKNGLGR